MRIKPTIQDYKTYTQEDFEVWKLLFSRQMELLSPNASKLYLDALKDIGFNQEEIPCFSKTNERLMSKTGWQLTVAPELVPQHEFFSLLSQKIFPATCWLRQMCEFDYLEEPDMFHDVFGHAPLLINKDYANFMEGFGKLAMKWCADPDAIRLLSRIYWFTIEFGLLEENGITKIFGAGIISSIGETRHALSDKTQKPPFDINRLLTTAYRTDILQEIYFIIDSFTQLYAALPSIDMLLENVLASELIT